MRYRIDQRVHRDQVLEYENTHAVTAPEKDALVREDIVRRFRQSLARVYDQF